MRAAFSSRLAWVVAADADFYPAFGVGCDNQPSLPLGVVRPEHWIRGHRADPGFQQFEGATRTAVACLFVNIPVHRTTVGNLAQWSNRQRMMRRA